MNVLLIFFYEAYVLVLTIIMHVALYSLSPFVTPSVFHSRPETHSFPSIIGGTAAAAPPPSGLATLPSVGAVP